MQTSNFQIIVLGICTTLILVGVAVFASFGGLLGGSGVGKVVIWGTLDVQVMQDALDVLKSEDKKLDGVSYVKKDPATYNQELVNAMANGTAPDLFMLSSSDLQSFTDKILTIPYGAVSQSSYLGSFVDEAQIFLTTQGSLALPITIDPLVMYWNRDLFASAGYGNPPQYWNDFLSLAPKITSLDSSSNVKKSAVALGQWANIDHAKEILSTLIMQTGDTIASRGSDGKINVTLGSVPQGYTSSPAASALQFYSEFANPSKTSYSWNRALPQSSRAFSAGTLAAYFGRVSEYQGISARNPNLRFSVALMPQIEGNATRLTYGEIVGLAIPLTAHNPKGALEAAQKFSSKTPASYLAQALALPSVRRDAVADTSANANAEIFRQSALISRAWLDPAQTGSNAVFKDMIESVVSGKSTPPEAISDASQALSRLFK